MSLSSQARSLSEAVFDIGIQRSGVHNVDSPFLMVPDEVEAVSKLRGGNPPRDVLSWFHSRS
jgi:hypothetical protein